MNLNQPSSSSVMHGRVGRLGLAILTLAIATAPAILFFDPADIWPGRAHIAREPLAYYRIFSDDVAYVASSRTWPRTVSNLFIPHNTHIVPAWRLVTFALVTGAGSYERLPEVLAVASYSILVAVMLMTGRLVTRETGQTVLGMGAMVVVGTTSVMLTPATWYSAGQPLWAGLGILITLWYAQSYRRSGRWPALALASLSAPIAGWFWTVGHMAGPAAAVYLFVDGRRRCRLAAAIPFVATVLAVALSLAMAARRIDATVSFHGRTVRQAINPIQGLLHTAQAIPENLVFANLGLTVTTTQSQGAFLTLGLFVLWTGRFWRWLSRPGKESDLADAPGKPPPRAPRFNPLECAGAATLVGAYLMEWSFRGYLEFQFLRTMNLRFIVPWYDTIPQIGAVLLVTGWCSSAQRSGQGPPRVAKPTSLTRIGGLGVAVLVVVLILLNRPRVDALVRASVHPLLPSERRRFPVPWMQTIRANGLLMQQAEWQRAYLRRLDRAEAVARRLGVGRETIRTVLDRPWIPGTVGHLLPPLYELYDAAGMLDLPEPGRTVDPNMVRGALAALFAREPEPRPPWIDADEPWPPPDEDPRVPQ